MIKQARVRNNDEQDTMLRGKTMPRKKLTTGQKESIQTRATTGILNRANTGEEQQQ